MRSLKKKKTTCLHLWPVAQVFEEGSECPDVETPVMNRFSSSQHGPERRAHKRKQEVRLDSPRRQWARVSIFLCRTAVEGQRVLWENCIPGHSHQECGRRTVFNLLRAGPSFHLIQRNAPRLCGDSCPTQKGCLHFRLVESLRPSLLQPPKPLSVCPLQTHTHRWPRSTHRPLTSNCSLPSSLCSKHLAPLS